MKNKGVFMKNFLALLATLFLCIPPMNLFAAPQKTWDEESQTIIRPPSLSEKLFRKIKKHLIFCTLATSALITTYYFFALGDESLPDTSPLNPCGFDAQDIFDIHACMHYMQSSMDTSSFEDFLTDAQEQLASLWKQMPDAETLYPTLEKIWLMLQNDQCHIHDEL